MKVVLFAVGYVVAAVVERIEKLVQFSRRR